MNRKTATHKETYVPQLRFGEFNDNWEQRKLGVLLQTLPFKRFLKEPEADGKYEIIQQGNEPIIGFANGTPCDDYKDVVIFGDHTLSLYKPQRSFFVATDGVRIVKGQQDTDGYYLLSLLERYKPQNEGYKRYFSILADTNCITTYNASEQKPIGSFFQQLDRLITLHQHKYERLKTLKQAMLQKMFPREGELVPEIRFEGFTEPWEQRKLEDYLTVSTEKNTDNIYGRSDVLSVSGDYGIVNQIEFQGRSFAGASVLNYGVVQTGDVVYTKSPLNSNPYGIIKTNKGKPGIVSTLYAVYHPKENTFSDFIQVYFEQHARMNNYMHPLVNKGAKNDMKVSAENALKGPVCFPSRVEQESISAFFSVLDHLITLHQRKYEKLLECKKAFLTKMFPG